jgi:hypothetical protein
VPQREDLPESALRCLRLLGAGYPMAREYGGFGTIRANDGFSDDTHSFSVATVNALHARGLICEDSGWWVLTRRGREWALEQICEATGTPLPGAPREGASE